MVIIRLRYLLGIKIKITIVIPVRGGGSYAAKLSIIIIMIIITDLYSAFRFEDTEALHAAQAD